MVASRGLPYQQKKAKAKRNGNMRQRIRAALIFIVTLCGIGGVMAEITTSAPQGLQSVVSPAWRAANIKEFTAQLNLFHPGGNQTTPEELEDGVEKLIRDGVSRDEAFRSILTVVQRPTINPAAAYSLAELGRRITAANRGEIIR